MKLDAQAPEFVQDLKEMFCVARKTVARPDQHCVELMAIGILQQLVKGWASDFGAADAMVNIFMDNLVAALLSELAQLDSLRFWVLVDG
jgi:hypothetical protein